MLHVMFSADVSNLTIEILAAVVAVVMVVVSVAVTLHFQADYEAEKEFKTEVFKEKLQKYYQLLATLSEADDDNHISEKEMNQMKNLARSVALIATPRVVITLANFIEEVEEHGRLFIDTKDLMARKKGLEKEEYRGTFRNLVIQMRKDLEVVDLNQVEQVRDAIRRLVEPSTQENEVPNADQQSN